MTIKEITEAKREAAMIQAILNLSCVVMARNSTPAAREHAEKMLLGLVVEEEVIPHEFIHRPGQKTWLQLAREACLNWRTL